MRTHPDQLYPGKSAYLTRDHHQERPGAFTPNWPHCQCFYCLDVRSEQTLAQLAALIALSVPREDPRPPVLRLEQSEKITRQTVWRKGLATARLKAHLPHKPRKIRRSAPHRRTSGQSYFSPLGYGADVRYLDLPPRNAIRHAPLRTALERTPFWVTYRRLRARFRKKHLRLVTDTYSGYTPIDRI